MSLTLARARQVLAACGGNVSEAARRVGMSRATWRCRFGSIGAKQRSKGETTVILADIHAPYHDEQALSVALDYIEARKPDRVVLNGDCVDFYAASHWRKDPARSSLKHEIETACEVLERITESAGSAEKVYIEGNHEERLRALLWSRVPELDGVVTVPELLNLGALGWDYVSNSERLKKGEEAYHLGKLAVLHGHEVKASVVAVNIPRIYYFKCHQNLLVAHHHQAQEFIAHKLDGSHDGAWSMGCLCHLHAEYMPVTNWVHGFAVVESDEGGNFVLQNRKIIKGVLR